MLHDNLKQNGLRHQPVDISNVKNAWNTQAANIPQSDSSFQGIESEAELPAPGNVQESLLEYLEAVTGIRKHTLQSGYFASSMSSLSPKFKTIQEKNYFDGLSRWVESILGRFKQSSLPQNNLQEFVGIATNSVSSTAAPISDYIFYKGSFPQASTRTSFDGSVTGRTEDMNIHHRDSFNSQSPQGTINPPNVLSFFPANFQASQSEEENILHILRETENIVYVLSDEDEDIELQDVPLNYLQTSCSAFPGVPRFMKLMECVSSMEMILSWLQYHIHLNDFDSPTSAGDDITQTLAHVSKSTTKQQQQAAAIVQPKQLFLYAYRIIHLIESIGKLKLWVVLATSNTMGRHENTCDNICQLLRLLRCLVITQEIQTHIHLVSLTIPVPLSQNSRHDLPSLSRTPSGGKFTSASMINPVLFKLSQGLTSLARDLLQTIPNDEASKPSTIVTSIDVALLEFEGITASMEMLFLCNISSITGQHLHVHASHQSHVHGVSPMRLKSTSVIHSSPRTGNVSQRSSILSRSSDQSNEPSIGGNLMVDVDSDQDNGSGSDDDSADDIQTVVSRLQMSVGHNNDFARTRSQESTNSDASSQKRRVFSIGQGNSLAVWTSSMIFGLVEYATSLIVSLPSPSLIRSKLCYASYKYLEMLRKGKLPWQQYFSSLTSGGPSASTPKISTKVIPSSMIPSRQSIEIRIVKYFEQAFELSDIIDETRDITSQEFLQRLNYLDLLLLFESSADMFMPILPKDYPSPSISIGKTQGLSPSFNKGGGAFFRSDSADTPTQSQSRRLTTSTVASQDQISSIESIVLSLPISIDLCKRWDMSETARGESVGESSGIMTMIRTDVNFELLIKYYQHQNVSLQTSLVLSQFARVLIDRSTSHSYAIMEINYQLMKRSSLVPSGYQISQRSGPGSGVKMNPTIDYIGLAQSDASPPVMKVKRELLMLASRQQDYDKILETSLFLLEKLSSMDGTFTLNSPSSSVKVNTSPNTPSAMPSPGAGKSIISPIAYFEENTVEIRFLVELACKSYLENGMYEKAVGVIHDYVKLLTHRLFRAVTSMEPTSSRLLSTTEKILHKYHRMVDPMMIKIGQIYLTASLPALAAYELQKFLEILAVRQTATITAAAASTGTSTSSKSGKIISVLNAVQSNTSSSGFDVIVSSLTWLFQAYCDMNNTEVCKKIIAVIKSIRNDLSIAQANVEMNSPSSTTLSSIYSPGLSSVRLSHLSETRTATTTSGSSTTDLGYDSMHNSGELGLSMSDSSQKIRRRQNSISERSTISKKSSDRGSTDNSSLIQISYNLPKVGITQYNLDLGEAIALIHFKSQGYIAALKSLTPTIIGMELSAKYIQNAIDVLTAESSRNRSTLTSSFVTSISEAKAELARLYYLRGEIEMEAAKSSNVKYPFVIGSSELFTAIHLVYEQARFAPKSSSSGLNARDFDGEVMITCRNEIQYKSPSDLLWDAMKWFQRSWECFSSIQNYVYASKAAMKYASCHLEALYIPCVFFQKTKQFAGDLGTSGAGAVPVYSSWGAGEDELDEPQLQSSGMASDGLRYQQMDRQYSMTSDLGFRSNIRRASIEEIFRAVDFALSVCSETCSPLILLESYIAMAELKLIADESFEAVAYWWEAKELFSHLFVDGTVIPILRRCSISFAVAFSSILDRLVRFLWACERTLVNQNLALLDIHILCSHELDRIMKQAINRSNKVSGSLDTILDNLRESNSQLKSSSLSSALQDTMSSVPSEYRQVVSSWLTYCKNLSTSVTSVIGPIVLDPIATFPKGDLFATYSYSPGSNAPSPRTASSQATPRTLNMKDETIPSSRGHLSGTINAAVAAGTAQARKAERSTGIHESQYSFDEYSLSPSDRRDRDRDVVRQLGLPHWVTEGFTSNDAITEEDILRLQSPTAANVSSTVSFHDETIVENIWRCWTLIHQGTQRLEKFSSNASNSTNESVVLLRTISRKAMASLSVIMRRYRQLHRQIDGNDISYESLHRLFVKKVSIDEFLRIDSGAALAVNTAKKVVTMQERMQHLVYCLKVDDLLMMYRPHAGTQYIQPFCSSGYITYTEKSQAWLLLQNTSNQYTSGHGVRRGSSLGPGSSEFAINRDLTGDSYLTNTMNSRNLVSGENLGDVDDLNTSMMKRESGKELSSFGISVDEAVNAEFAVLDYDIDRDRGYSNLTLPDITQTDNTTGAISSLEVSWTMNSSPLRPIGEHEGDQDEEDEDDEDSFRRRTVPSSLAKTILNSPADPSIVPTGGIKRLNSVKYNRSNRSILSMSSGGSSHTPSIRTSHPIPQEYLTAPPSGSNLPSYASIASSTTSVRIPKSTSFTSDQTKLLFDLAVEMTDATCGGGYEFRKNLLNQMRHGDFLRGAIEFLRDAEYDPISPSDDSSAGSNSYTRRQVAPGEEMRKYNAFLPSGFLRMFQQKTESSPPSMPPPVTLICSRATSSIPWETLAGPYPEGSRGPHGEDQLIIVRQSSLMTLFAFVRIKGGNYLTGPAWHQAPLFISVAQGINGLPIRLANDVKAREVSRRIVSSIHSIEALTHKVSHLVRASKELIIASSPMISSSSDDVYKKYSGICQFFQERMWPNPSALLPLGKVSGQSLRSRRLKKFLFYDLSSLIAAPSGSRDESVERLRGPTASFQYRQLTHWIDTQINHHSSYVTVTPSLMSPTSGAVQSPSVSSHQGPSPTTIAPANLPLIFPVVVLTYADLLEMSEAVALLLMTRGDAVVVFAPHFCQGTVAKEIVRSLDTWSPACVQAAPPTPTAAVSTSGQLSLFAPNSNAGKRTTASIGSISELSEPILESSVAMSNRMSLAPTIPYGGVVSAGASVATATTVYEPNDVDLSNKTLAYHIIMDTVNRLQNELNVPIVVFI